MAADLNQEIDALLQMMEEIVKIALRIREENNQKKSAVATNASKLPITPEMDESQDAVVSKLDDKMKDISNIKSDMAYQLNHGDQIQNLNETAQHDDLRKSFNDLVSQLNEINSKIEGFDFNSSSLLGQLGQSLIHFDKQIKDLGDRITEHIKQLPETAKVVAITFVAGHLDRLGKTVEALKNHLSDKIKENAIEIEVSGAQDMTSGQTQTPARDLTDNLNTKTTKELLSVMDPNNFFTIKDLILQNVSKDFDLMQGAIDEHCQRTRVKDNVVGLKTEIDPAATSLESLSGIEQAGIKTVASVKDELEDITLSEYSDHMEDEYQNGFDTNPNFATEVTDEEWASQSAIAADPWEQEM